MKVLVLEENEKIVDLYKKIFEQKKIQADFLKKVPEFFQKFREDYDFFILENPILASKFLLDKNHQKMFNNKIIVLSAFINKSSEISNVSKETRDILEKPFAMITLLSKLEIDLHKKAIVV